jgi:hypothetical protein
MVLADDNGGNGAKTGRKILAVPSIRGQSFGND